MGYVLSVHTSLEIRVHVETRVLLRLSGGGARGGVSGEVHAAIDAAIQLSIWNIIFFQAAY